MRSLFSHAVTEWPNGPGAAAWRARSAAPAGRRRGTAGRHQDRRDFRTAWPGLAHPLRGAGRRTTWRPSRSTALIGSRCSGMLLMLPMPPACLRPPSPDMGVRARCPGPLASGAPGSGAAMDGVLRVCLIHSAFTPRDSPPDRGRGTWQAPSRRRQADRAASRSHFSCSGSSRSWLFRKAVVSSSRSRIRGKGALGVPIGHDLHLLVIRMRHTRTRPTNRVHAPGSRPRGAGPRGVCPLPPGPGRSREPWVVRVGSRRLGRR